MIGRFPLTGNSLTATLHDEACPMVAKQGGSMLGKKYMTFNATPGAIADLKERGYKVKKCPCVKG